MSSSLDLIILIMFAEQITELLIRQFSPASCHFIPLRSKYSRKHPVLEHPQSVFFLQRDTPSSTPIQKTGKIIVQNYLNFATFSKDSLATLK
jgi:hypothetical protein